MSIKKEIVETLKYTTTNGTVCNNAVDALATEYRDLLVSMLDHSIDDGTVYFLKFLNANRKHIQSMVSDMVELDKFESDFIVRRASNGT